MNKDTDKISEEFLQISSHLRLGIILSLSNNKATLSELSKTLDVTTSELHRNLSRLMTANLIAKESSGKYLLTTYGKMIKIQLSSWNFFINNQKYFTKHQFAELPENFIQSIGSLEHSKHVKGFVNIQEIWKNIYKNSQKYVYNILYEISYDSEILDLLKSKLKKDVIINTIFSKDAIIPQKRKTVITIPEIQDAIKNSKLQRKISDLSVLVVLNEKEGCVMFPKNDGDVDVSEGFYGKTELFHNWCLNYFQYCWERSSAFYEEKIKT